MFNKILVIVDCAISFWPLSYEFHACMAYKKASVHQAYKKASVHQAYKSTIYGHLWLVHWVFFVYMNLFIFHFPLNILSFWYQLRTFFMSTLNCYLLIHVHSLLEAFAEEGLSISSHTISHLSKSLKFMHVHTCRSLSAVMCSYACLSEPTLSIICWIMMYM